MDLLPPELIVMIKDLLTNKDLWTFNCVHPYINYHTISKRQLYLRQHKVWNISIQDARSCNNNVLHWAAIKGHLKVIQYLVETVQLTVDDARAADALCCAAANGHLKVIQYLVAFVGLTATDARADNNYALRWAAYGGHHKVIQYLVAFVGLTATDARAGDNFALRCAAQNGHLKVVQYLVETVGLTADDIRANNNDAWRYGACNVRQYIRKCLNK